MAVTRGRLGAIYYPDGDRDVGTLGLSQVGGASSGTGNYILTTPATRIATAIKPSAVVGDFEIDPGNLTPTSMIGPVGEWATTADLSTPTFDAGTTATACYSLAQAGGFVNWRLSVTPDTEDITEFGDSWAQHVSLLKRWSITAEGFWQDENFTVDAASGNVDIDDTPMVLVAFVNTGSSAYTRFMGYVEGLAFEVNAAVNAVISKSITFTGHQGLYYRNGDISP
jgi:hypothetical protein